MTLKEVSPFPSEVPGRVAMQEPNRTFFPPQGGPIVPGSCVRVSVLRVMILALIHVFVSPQVNEVDGKEYVKIALW